MLCGGEVTMPPGPENKSCRSGASPVPITGGPLRLILTKAPRRFATQVTGSPDECIDTHVAIGHSPVTLVAASAAAKAPGELGSRSRRRCLSTPPPTTLMRSMTERTRRDSTHRSAASSGP